MWKRDERSLYYVEVAEIAQRAASEAKGKLDKRGIISLHLAPPPTASPTSLWDLRI